MSQGFRDLETWKRGIELVESIYRATSGFPADERFGLTSQLRRAAVSIPSCLAEGRERQSTREFARHVAMALGSVAEVETQLIISQRLGFAPTTLEPLIDQARELGRMLQGLRKALDRKLAKAREDAPYQLTTGN